MIKNDWANVPYIGDILIQVISTEECTALLFKSGKQIKDVLFSAGVASTWSRYPMSDALGSKIREVHVVSDMGELVFGSTRVRFSVEEYQPTRILQEAENLFDGRPADESPPMRVVVSEPIVPVAPIKNRKVAAARPKKRANKDVVIFKKPPTVKEIPYQVRNRRPKKT